MQTTPEIFKKVSPLQLFHEKSLVCICAPMVRYSKLPFRELVRKYSTDIAYTPMIIAEEFRNSSYARDTDFLTSQTDDPVIIQFAANDPFVLADAVELSARFSNGVDLNCGCPQKWAIQEKLGSYLLEKPDLIRDMVRAVNDRTSGLGWWGDEGYPCSIKIRIGNDLRKTVDLVQKAEKAGVSWIGVHGRTRSQRSSELPNYDAIKLVKECVSVPVVANGDVFNLEDAKRIQQNTGVDGVMAARGLLQNPALFAGYNETPMECIEDYVRLALSYGTNKFIFHHHLSFMMETQMSRIEKQRFNILPSIPSIIDFLQQYYNICK